MQFATIHALEARAAPTICNGGHDMPTVNRNSLRRAVAHVAKTGDTDVFPLPVENHWFFDDQEAVIALLEDLDANFLDWIGRYPIHFVKTLAGVGYNGFRAATQIDAIWNAYLLGLVIEIGADVEAARIPPAANSVFAYRFDISATSELLFRGDYGWSNFQAEALNKARDFGVVIATDISDFYSRVYHHRLENALVGCTQKRDVANRIMEILKRLSENASYGLPVGGDAARLLAELLLNRVDRLLQTERVPFMRFVDDYYIFAQDRESAHRHLVFLSERLLRNEGLTLSRNKTRVLTRAEFVKSSPASPADQAESQEEDVARRFLQIRLSYNPYSPTADDEYQQLSEELKRFDILAMLSREFAKSRIDEALVRQLVKAIRFLTPQLQDAAINSLLDNFAVLYPVFPTVAILLRRLLDGLSSETKEKLFQKLRNLLSTGSHITLVPTNAVYAVRLLAHDRSEEVDSLLADLYGRFSADMMLKRDIILAMAKRHAEYWLSDILKRFSTLSAWEQRALLVASYALRDEGKHWRNSKRAQLSAVDDAFLKWLGTRNTGSSWEVPL